MNDTSRPTPEQMAATITLLLSQRRSLLEIFLSHMNPLQQESAIEHLEFVCEQRGWVDLPASEISPEASCELGRPLSQG